MTQSQTPTPTPTQTQTPSQTQTSHPAYASPADTGRHGEYRIDSSDPRPRYRFTGRLVTAGADTQDGPGCFVAEPGRFHLYSGWFCPWAQRSTLVIALAGLSHVVSVSYVDGLRDARGWAFRESTGPDPVNGFTLLRQAYEATQPGFDGHVSVPTLWDRRTHRVVSNDFTTLDADLATHFQRWSTTGVELYPADLRGEIDELERWLLPRFNRGVTRAAKDGDDAGRARAGVGAVFDQLEETFGNSRYLLGERLTLADVRLFVTLVRYDAGSNAGGRVGPRLNELPNVWAYARDLFQQDAFRSTTRFASFTTARSGWGVRVAEWDEPVVRDLGTP
jgi:glutathionyl-hydroquinone reductase